MLDAVLERVIFRLRRLIQTLSTHIVEPTVIATPNAGIFDSAELQGSPAVRAMETQDA
jgi:hypothetical protein